MFTPPAAGGSAGAASGRGAAAASIATGAGAGAAAAATAPVVMGGPSPALIAIFTAAPPARKEVELPSPDAIRASLLATRARLQASPEFRLLVAAAKQARDSAVGKLLIAEGKAAATFAAKHGIDLARNVADSVVGSNVLAAGLASTFGYKTKQQQSAEQQARSAVASASAAGAIAAAMRAAGAGAAAPAAALAPAAPAFQTPALPPVLMRCPYCEQLIQAPAGAPLFRCMCGNLLQRQ
jgi:hypothetical protein